MNVTNLRVNRVNQQKSITEVPHIVGSMGLAAFAPSLAR